MTTTARIAIALAAAVLVGLGIVGERLAMEPLVEFDLLDLIGLTVAVAIGEWVLLPRRTGPAAALSMAVVAAVALLLQSPSLVAGVGAAGWTTYAITRFALGREVDWGGIVGGLLLAWGGAGLARVAHLVDPGSVAVGQSETALAPLAVVWALLLFGLPAVGTMVAMMTPAVAPARYADLFGAGVAVNLVVATAATLGALAYPALGLLAVLLMVLPMGAAKLGFDRDAGTRRNFDQMLRAMSRLPEQLGAVHHGHGEEVGEVAGLAAARLGMGAEAATDVRRAAQLHELGRIQAPEDQELSPVEVATGGAAILQEAGGLDRTARFVLAHRDAFSGVDPDAGRAGELIRLACALDERLLARPRHRMLRSDHDWIQRTASHPDVAKAMGHAADVVWG